MRKDDRTWFLVSADCDIVSPGATGGRRMLMHNNGTISTLGAGKHLKVNVIPARSAITEVITLG